LKADSKRVFAFHFRGVLAILGYSICSCFVFVSTIGERGMV
jgi:hypothetical protein